MLKYQPTQDILSKRKKHQEQPLRIQCSSNSSKRLNNSSIASNDSKLDKNKLHLPHHISNFKHTHLQTPLRDKSNVKTFLIKKSKSLPHKDGDPKITTKIMKDELVKETKTILQHQVSKLIRGYVDFLLINEFFMENQSSITSSSQNFVNAFENLYFLLQNYEESSGSNFSQIINLEKNMIGKYKKMEVYNHQEPSIHVLQDNRLQLLKEIDILNESIKKMFQQKQTQEETVLNHSIMAQKLAQIYKDNLRKQKILEYDLIDANKKLLKIQEKISQCENHHKQLIQKNSFIITEIQQRIVDENIFLQNIDVLKEKQIKSGQPYLKQAAQHYFTKKQEIFDLCELMIGQYQHQIPDELPRELHLAQRQISNHVLTNISFLASLKTEDHLKRKECFEKILNNIEKLYLDLVNKQMIVIDSKAKSIQRIVTRLRSWRSTVQAKTSFYRKLHKQYAELSHKFNLKATEATLIENTSCLACCESYARNNQLIVIFKMIDQNYKEASLFS